MQNKAAPFVVLSHLRWNWVYQRPQHLLSRFARQHRVFFIEEPVYSEDGGEPRWQCSQPAENVTVCNAITPVPDPGFNDHQMPSLRRLMAELVEREKLEGCIAWFYTPMAVPLLDTLSPSAVVYDCMDELSGFRGAPPELLERESELFRAADVVFTGGPSLYRSKRDRHPNVHCFPSSVDAAHFGQARNGQDAPDQATLPHPRLGFFGVIDERIDLPLLDAMATRRPDWQIVMVGPTTKIDPATLPRHSNIHYFGQRSYAALPSFLAGWDVCILPFAQNEATRFISPTKTLEYMVAEKPTVSTPITDVAEPYGDIVHLGGTPDEFIAACDRALGESEEERATRFEGMRRVLTRTSWDATVRAMQAEIDAVVAKKAPEAVRPFGGGEAGSQPPRRKAPVVVIGAGPTGLSATYHCPDALLLERNDHVGGWCRSIEQEGFTWDYAGHIMFSNDPYVHELYQKLLGDNVHWQDREAWIFSKGVYTRYPFQGALYGLPTDVIKECILGAIEARFGALKSEAKPAGPADTHGSNGNGRHADGNGHAKAASDAGARREEASRCLMGDVKDCCGDGVLESTAKLEWAERLRSGRTGGNGHSDGNGHSRGNGHADGNGHSAGSQPPTENFEEFIYRVWGRGIARHFAIPYNRKIWAVPLTEMETSWLGGRVPLPDLEEMIEGALKPVPRPMGPNARFGYPLRGGFQALMNGFLPFIQDRVQLNADVAAISPSAHTVTLADGSVIGYDHLISTMPLPVLVRRMGDEAPPEIQKAAAGLRYTSVRCVNIAVGRENISEKHWIYYPEEHTVFHRIFLQGNASPHCNAPGGFCFTCEITYGPSKPLPCDGDALIQRCIDECRKVGFLREDDPIICANMADMPHAYVVYDHNRARNVKMIREWLAPYDIILAGRYSEWEYYNSDHAFIAGKKAAEKVESLRRQESSPLTLAG